MGFINSACVFFAVAGALMYLNEATLLNNVRLHYNKDNIYVSESAVQLSRHCESNTVNHMRLAVIDIRVHVYVNYVVNSIMIHMLCSLYL